MDVGFLAVVPPLLAIILAIVTKEVLLSLFIAVFTGCMIIANWNPMAAVVKMLEIFVGSYDEEEVFTPGAITDSQNAMVLIMIILIGGIIGLMVRSGGSAAFGELLGRKIKTKKGAQGATWLVGMIIFFDDYFNALTNGAIMRQISDKYGVSREKLSYIIDSTAVGICLIAPLSSWVAFICSLLGDSFNRLGIVDDPYKIFVTAIPYNYYAWLSIIMVIVVIYLNLDFGPMAKAEKRTEETGALCDKTFSGGSADEDDYSAIEPAKGKPNDLLIPIITLIIGTLVLMLYTGGFFEHFDVMEAVNSMDGMAAITYAFGLIVVLCIIMYAVKGLSKVLESIAAFVIGAKSVVYVIILLSFAWAIGGVGDELDTAGYMVQVFQAGVPSFLTPVFIFIIACVMTFSTGATWGTYAIMIPLAVPLGDAMGVSVLACVTAVVGGGGFGNHCSPLADTAILSSAASNIRHTDHIKTQIPYSVTCAVCACVGYIVSGFINNWYIPLAVTIGTFVVAILILNKLFGKNKYTVDTVGEGAIKASKVEGKNKDPKS